MKWRDRLQAALLAENPDANSAESVDSLPPDARAASTGFNGAIGNGETRRTAPQRALLSDNAHPAREGIGSADLPPAWLAGVVLLATLAPPDGIEPRRWAVLALISARLLRDHGMALHRAGWNTLDLFGLHQRAPATNPPGWGLAWLLGEAGAVLDVSHNAVGMCRESGGARLSYRRRSAMARAEVVPAWELKAPLLSAL